MGKEDTPFDTIASVSFYVSGNTDLSKNQTFNLFNLSEYSS
jgi:hypothetical protein